VTDALQLHKDTSYLNPPVSAAAQLVSTFKAVLRAPIDLLRPAAPVGAPESAVDAEAAARSMVARQLREKIEISRVGRSSAFFIGFTSHDPVIAKKVTDAYAKAYVADLLNANFEATEQTTEWLQVRLDDLQDSAQQAAMKAERFRTENGLVSSRGALMTEQNVGQLNADLAEAVAELARSRALMDTYDDVIKQGPNALIGEDGLRFTLPGDDRLQLMQEDLSAQIGRLAEAERRSVPGEVQTDALRGQIDRQLKALFVELETLSEAARGEFEVADARVTALRDSLGMALDTNSAASEAQVQLRALEQRATTLSMLYQTFLTRFQEMDQQKTFPISNVRILSEAEMPRSPNSPSTSSVLAFMLVLGLLAGFLTAILREWRDRFLRTGDDVSAETGSKFLGYLPLVPADGSSDRVAGTVTKGRFNSLRSWLPKRPVQNLQFRHKHAAAARKSPDAMDYETRNLAYVADHPRSLFAETIRNIRFASDVRMGDRAGRIIGVTSVLPGEGKSTIAANLATMLAAFDDPVLLIDADPRNPGLSRSLRLTGSPGLVEALMGKAQWRTLINVQQETGVHLLTCETPKLMSYSSELLGSATMRALLTELRTEFPTIILDLAPLGPVVDARVLLPMIDQVVLVSEWGTTPKELLRATLGGEPALVDKLLGVVLNKVDMVALKDYVPRASNEAFYHDYGDYFSPGT
jgi:polysaccharide biosynthesis transport protein